MTDFIPSAFTLPGEWPLPGLPPGALTNWRRGTWAYGAVDPPGLLWRRGIWTDLVTSKEA